MTHGPDRAEHNRIIVSDSTLQGSPVTAGSGARIDVSSSGDHTEHEAITALVELREALQRKLREIDRRDDDLYEQVQIALVRLDGLEAELGASKEKRDKGRITRLMAGIRDTVTGLAGITASADSLGEAIAQITS